MAFEIDVPAHRRHIPGGDLVQRRTLQATGLFRPAAGDRLFGRSPMRVAASSRRVPDLGSRALLAPPRPAPEGGVVGWLTFTDAQSAVRHSGLLAGLRKGRLLRAGVPFAWAALDGVPPPRPST